MRIPQANQFNHFKVSLPYRVALFLSLGQMRRSIIQNNRRITTLASILKIPSIVKSPSSRSSIDSYPSPISPSVKSSYDDLAAKERSPKELNKRLSDFMAMHHPKETSMKEKREERREQFLVDSRTKRNQLFNSNRGIWLCGEALFWGGKGGKVNLGNDLQIAEGRYPALDKDKNQEYPPHLVSDDSIFFVKPKLLSASSESMSVVPIKIHSIRGSKGLEESSLYHKIAFAEANQLVTDTFAERGIIADLSRVVESGFTVDLAIKQSFHQIKQEITPDTSLISRDSVLGACLFVNMKKFVWVEEIAVGKQAQGMGVGRVLIDRMKDVARFKKKDLLLYGITEAIPFYMSLGFEPIRLWEITGKQFSGEYLTWKSE